jgi:hypothetical protein
LCENTEMRPHPGGQSSQVVCAPVCTEAQAVPRLLRACGRFVAASFLCLRRSSAADGDAYEPARQTHFQSPNHVGGNHDPHRQIRGCRHVRVDDCDRRPHARTSFVTGLRLAAPSSGSCRSWNARSALISRANCATTSHSAFRSPPVAARSRREDRAERVRFRPRVHRSGACVRGSRTRARCDLRRAARAHRSVQAKRLRQ